MPVTPGPWPLPVFCTAQMTVPSPCINVCVMDKASGLCQGCLRTLDEITAWGRASDPQRLAILDAVAARRALQSNDSNARSPQ